MSQPAGWYPQPDGTQRYWDGAQWTTYVSPQVSQQASPPASVRPKVPWYKRKRVIIPVGFVAVIVVLSAIGGGGGNRVDQSAQAPAPVVASASVVDSKTSDPEVSADTDPSEDVAEESDDSQSMSVSQEQAVEKAQEYLDYTAFSRSGLIKQLKYEGFSAADAKFGADHAGADWMKQAALKAQEYLDYTSFSRSSLIKQLQFEGFTRKQAEHGAKAVGL